MADRVGPKSTLGDQVLEEPRRDADERVREVAAAAALEPWEHDLEHLLNRATES